MTAYQTNQSAQVANQALKVSLQTMEQAKQCAILWFGDILERGLYRQLGYSSINQYAQIELGFSATRTGDFLSLCRKLEKLPKVREQVASGKLGYTKARVLVGVADRTNEEAWVQVALGSSRRELERQVKQAKQEAAQPGQGSLLPVVPTRPQAVVPVRVSLEMSPTQFARYETLWEQIRKKGDAPADKVEALLAIMTEFTAQTSPRGDVAPPAQIHLHQCPDCEKVSVQTSKGELELSSAELERAQCDCQISEPGQPNRSTIPPTTRRRVLARDRHKCQQPGCHHTRYLEIHHKTPRSQGGTNQTDNLTTLCSACHRLLHEKGHSTARQPQACYLTRVMVRDCTDRPAISRYT